MLALMSAERANAFQLTLARHAACGGSGMLSLTIVFLLIAIFAGVFGFVAAGPVGLVLFAVFFALFIWSMIRDRKSRPPR